MGGLLRGLTMLPNNQDNCAAPYKSLLGNNLHLNKKKHMSSLKQKTTRIQEIGCKYVCSIQQSAQKFGHKSSDVWTQYPRITGKWSRGM